MEFGHRYNWSYGPLWRIFVQPLVLSETSFQGTFESLVLGHPFPKQHQLQKYDTGIEGPINNPQKYLGRIESSTNPPNNQVPCLLLHFSGVLTDNPGSPTTFFDRLVYEAPFFIGCIIIQKEVYHFFKWWRNDFLGLHTVDGSEIPRTTTVWMVVKPVANNGINW